MFYGFFEALFGCRENDVFYAYLEPVAKGTFFGEKPLFAKVPYFIGFPLLTPFGDFLFLLFAEL